MSFKQLATQVESQSFDARLSVASGFSVFYNALQHEHAVQELLELATQSENAIKSINARLSKLLSETTDTNYCHPHDTAISAYLFVLHEVSNAIPKATIDKITHSPNLWWTRRLLEKIEEESEDTSPSLIEN
jgi:hypothetical protein